jgi:hypothetical protein
MADVDGLGADVAKGGDVPETGERQQAFNL